MLADVLQIKASRLSLANFVLDDSMYRGRASSDLVPLYRAPGAARQSCSPTPARLSSINTLDSTRVPGYATSKQTPITRPVQAEAKRLKSHPAVPVSHQTQPRQSVSTVNIPSQAHLPICQEARQYFPSCEGLSDFHTSRADFNTVATDSPPLVGTQFSSAKGGYPDPSSGLL